MRTTERRTERGTRAKTPSPARLALPLAALLVLAGAGPAPACTGFAVYSDSPIYGMNFDYDLDVPVRLLIDDSGGTRAFHLAFIRGPRMMPRTAGMNEHGLFVSTQELHPMAKAGPPGPGEQCPGGLYRQTLSEFATVADVAEHLETTRMVNCHNLSLHVLFADPSGDAMIVEPAGYTPGDVESGSKDHHITRPEDGRIVMTNFANCRFVGADRDSIFGFGADRYRISHDYLDENVDGFDVEDGLELLERASWRYTRCSLVFDPVAREVYVAIEGDFSKILRVSLDDATVETYTGYDEHRSWKLDRLGLPITALAEGRGASFFERIRGFFRG
jgi:hypothetical protein